MAFDPDTRREKAIAFASDASKLLITLATAFVAFTVTFSEKLGGLVFPTGWATLPLVGAWAVFAVSVGCGLWTQLALTQELEPKPGSAAAARDPSIRAPSVKLALACQIVTFVAATALAIVFGAVRISAPAAPPPPPSSSSTGALSGLKIPLPAFESGSADAPEVALVNAVCDARRMLSISGAAFAIVVGRHDMQRLTARSVERFGSNPVLAQHRADYVVRLLGDAARCKSDSPPITAAVALAGPPRDGGRGLRLGGAATMKQVPDDRRVEIYGLGIQSASTSGTPSAPGKP